MPNIVIEKLCKSDIKDAIEIYDENHNTKTDLKKLNSEYDKIYENPDYHNIVAKIEGKVVGLATIIINHDIVEELKTFITVWNVGVHKDYRRMKVGTKMLDYIYDFAKKNDSLFVALLADIENETSQKFYESLGYNREVGYMKFIKTCEK